MKPRQSMGGGVGLLILVMVLFMMFSVRTQRMQQDTTVNFPQFEKFSEVARRFSFFPLTTRMNYKRAEDKCKPFCFERFTFILLK